MRETHAVLTDPDRSELVQRANAAPAAPAVHDSSVTTVYHYTEDGTLKRFAPHVPPTNPGHPPAVWAIDERHSPLYWFPRNCPRISVWAHDADQQSRLTAIFETEATRLCAAETHWMLRVRDAKIYRYEFDASQFRPWDDADGQYISDDVVYPTRVEPMNDLLAIHAAAQIELRFTPRLGSLMDSILSSGLPFSFVRIRDALR